MRNSSEKTLIIKAKGGLGNRMLSAISGLIFADIAGRQPVIDWRDGVYADPGVNAYPLLFDSPAMPDPAAFDDKTDTSPSIWSGKLSRHPVDMIEQHDPTRHSDPFVYRKYCMNLSEPEDPAEIGVFWCYLPKTFRLRRWIHKQERFAGMSLDSIVSDYLRRYFTPNSRVRKAVKDALAPCKTPTIGVHVRYTDRKISLNGVRKAVRSLKLKYPDASLFLATDSNYVQDTFAEEFSDIHVTEKWLHESGQHLHMADTSRDSLVEAENAMIDMWALAECDFLVYSKHSTFSVASSLIGKIDTDHRIDIDRFNLPIVAKRYFQMFA